MKITKSQLKQIIKEELNEVFPPQEKETPPPGRGSQTSDFRPKTIKEEHLEE